MQPDLQVDTVALGACVPPLLDLGGDMTAGSTRIPRPPTVPRWESSDAAMALTDDVRAALLDLASSVSATGQAIDAALTDYAAADQRAAARARVFR
jgi:hypothetical protein